MAWELIEGNGVSSGTERLAVPGGWLYRSVWRFQHARLAFQEGSGVAFVSGDSGFVESAKCEIEEGARIRLNAATIKMYPHMADRRGTFIRAEGNGALVKWDDQTMPTPPEWRFVDLEIVPDEAAAVAAPVLDPAKTDNPVDDDWHDGVLADDGTIYPTPAEHA